MSGSPDGLPPLREVIRAFQLSAHKTLGQHFILDLNLTRRIARAVQPLSGRTIVEIGPGPGGLTRSLLLEGAERVVAVERDERFRPALQAIAERYPGKLDLHFGDALDADWPRLVGASAAKAAIVANLPYNVATTLLTGWLETEPWPPWYGQMVLMFQKEVAERVVAVPRTKAYGRLAVLTQWRTRPRMLFSLPPEAFTPPPSVASAVVEFKPLARPQPECSVEVLARVTGAAFGQRRKMLRQSLKTLVSDPQALLAATGLSPTSRAEELSVSDFGRLTYAVERWPGTLKRSQNG